MNAAGRRRRRRLKPPSLFTLFVGMFIAVAVLVNLTRRWPTDSPPSDSPLPNFPTTDSGKDYLSTLMEEELRAAGGADRYDEIRARLRASPQMPLRGLPRLALRDLDEHSALRLRMARASDSLCEKLWSGAPPDQDEFLRTFALFSDKDARAWARIMAVATVLAMDDDAPIVQSEGIPAEAIDQIAAKLPANDRKSFRQAFAQGADAAPTDGCRALRSLLEYSKTLPDELRDRTLRALLSP